MRPLSFIVAEDDDLLRDGMVTILRALGADVRSVRNGRELLALLAVVLADKEPVDLVITDVEMPHATGLQILETARALGLDVPFLVVSGSGRRDLHAYAAARRARILGKPFTAGTFLARVREMCGLEPFGRLPAIPDGSEN